MALLRRCLTRPARIDEFFLVVAAGSFVATIAVALVDDPAADGRLLPSWRTLLAEVRRRIIPVGDGRTALTANGLHWLYLAHGLQNMTISGLFRLMPAYLIAVVGTSEAEMGLLLGLGSALQIVFMYGFGRIVNARGRKSLVVYGTIKSGCVRADSGRGDAAGRIVPPRGSCGSGLLLRAIAVSAIFAGSYAFIGEVAPSGRESELMGLLLTVKGVGGVLGPLLFGVVATVAGYETAFAGASLLAFATSAFVAKGIVESYPQFSLRNPAPPSALAVTDTAGHFRE